MPGLMDRLRQQATLSAELAKDAAIKRGVRTFVRLNLAGIIELKRTVGSWAALADLLETEGLRWRIGNRVTGDHLRSLVAEIQGAAQRRKPRVDLAAESVAPGAVNSTCQSTTSREARIQKTKGLSGLLDT